MLTTRTLRMLGSGQLLGSEGGSWVALGRFWAALGWLLGNFAVDFWAALGWLWAVFGQHLDDSMSGAGLGRVLDAS